MIHVTGDDSKARLTHRLLDDFHARKQLHHENLLPLLSLIHDFGPLPAMVFPWINNGSLTTYLERHFTELTIEQKLQILLAFNISTLMKWPTQILQVAMCFFSHDGSALVADHGLLTTCSDLNGTSYIRSNVQWAAPALFEVPDTADVPSLPKIASDIYSFGCIAFQVLSGQQPYYNIRSDHQVVVTILGGIKPKRPNIPAIEDYHWNFIEQCWVELLQQYPIADV
ncbi:kinase-like domain-containing protein [Suillus cothurnatus]|nr:kinase-like domain-containing protein [Suillus cothurnatus]